MADPSPVLSLPDVEYLELYNRSGKPISLKGWKLVTGSRVAILPDSLIGPDTYITLCSKTNIAAMSPFSRVVGLGSLSLTNGGMLLALYNNRGQLVYSINYLNKWWPSDKRGGGYSLEMIDKDNPCGGMENWEVSADKRGGSPSEKNSVAGLNADIIAPTVERVNVLESGEVILIFNERMDSLNAVTGSEIEFSGHQIGKRQLESPSFRNLRFTPDPPLVNGKEYQFIIRNIADCSGNLLRESVHQIGLPSKAAYGDIVINEVLFNPRPSGVDYVELFNKSDKYLSLKNWSLGNTKNDSAAVFSKISTNEVSIPPHSYLALTTDVVVVMEQYPTSQSRYFLEMPSMPSFSDVDGGVILKDASDIIFDKLTYSERQHFELFSNVQGVSLEKIDASVSSLERSNWHSAASTAGFGTPGYSNSQVKSESGEDMFTVAPEAISPDNDGLDDYATIKYSQKMSGRIASVRIYNVGGNLIKNLLLNQLIGTHGDIQWDGTDGRGEMVPTGYYLLLIDIFDATGNKEQYKIRIVVARRDR